MERRGVRLGVRRGAGWAVGAMAAGAWALAAAVGPRAGHGQAADETMDWLFREAATRPATAPAAATRPATSPFGEAPARNPEARRGVIVLSNGERVKGMISTTREKPLRIWDPKAREYRDVPWAMVRSLEARVLWERDEREWRFKESGSDVKVYTGRTYPARETEYAVTLTDGSVITGGVVAPLYASAGERSVMYVLYKRSKGEAGKRLEELVYVKRVELEE